MKDYKSTAALAEVLGYQTEYYECGQGDPSYWWDEVLQNLSRRRIDAIFVPNLASLAIHVADGAALLSKLNALGVKLYCAELGCDDLFAMKDFDKKLCSLIRCVETLSKDAPQQKAR